LDVLAEVRVGNRNHLLLRALRPVANQVRKSMSVLHGRWHLDRARHVVVRIAKFVSQKLHLLGTAFRVVKDHHVVSRRHNALSRNLADQEEVVGVHSNHAGINDSPRQGVRQALGLVAVEEALVDSFVD